MKIWMFLFLFIPFSSNAQDFTIAATGQIGWGTILHVPYFSENHVDEYGLGGSLGIHLEKRIFQKVWLGTGLGWKQLSRKLTTRDYAVSFPTDLGGEPSGWIELARQRDSYGSVTINTQNNYFSLISLPFSISSDEISANSVGLIQ